MTPKSSRPTSAKPYSAVILAALGVGAIAGLAVFFNPTGAKPDLPPVEPSPESAKAAEAGRDLEWRLARAAVESGAGASSPVLLAQALIGLAGMAEDPLLTELGEAFQIPDGRADVTRAASAELMKDALPGRTALMTIWPIVSDENAARELAHYYNMELLMLKNPGQESLKAARTFLGLPSEDIVLDKDTPQFVATQGSFDLGEYQLFQAPLPQSDEDWERLRESVDDGTAEPIEPGVGEQVLREPVNPILFQTGLKIAAEGEVNLNYLSRELRRPLGDWTAWLKVKGLPTAPGRVIIAAKNGRPFLVLVEPSSS